MKPTDRARLTTALRDHVARIATDLRVKMRAPEVVRDRAIQLHADEKVAEDFDVWTDILSRRAAVLYPLSRLTSSSTFPIQRLYQVSKRAILR